MNVTPTPLPGVLIIEPAVFGDSRGLFMETFSAQRYRDEAGIALPFVQDNYSRSGKGVLRGLHFQKEHPQGKLISVLRGAVLDVAVDINPASATFGRHVAVELTEENHRQVWIPPGYAHGFCVISDSADFVYKCTDYYRPDDEAGLAWNCPILNIKWPTSCPVLSEKDKRYPGLDGLG
ncbi:dTDP-4-dehydrorhamnose 3,5-epimerase [Pusillimonas sp. SM2304]|uniref:dTDP-4-dehydrorhamnose 3,5-epimerase n=1 Tax=Pusillimonas sp. SM2304 TaxID=3073241 RepID=UPI002874630B|nr:dTDP-4-dehydrorhamnose 3,5-epimerase [Pusillimonas sp. SM2304]MDS1141156.1 dTDP-4-dehydrorhamnose 3,5-epimerase [Pusillimonas sp. SM2304]